MKKVVIDTTTKAFPNFIYKDASSHTPFIECEIEVVPGETWKGLILTVSTNGKYTVELTKKLD